MNKAPIILFVYNRPWHTKQTVEALQKNELAKDSELFIYSDAPKDASAEQAVEEVRDYIRNIDGFKNITVVERNENWGLAKSIIDGVTKIVNEYGKIIVLEDDHVTSKYFLNYMNDALEFYKERKEVWHISAWNYPLGGFVSSKKAFLWRVMNCWGWATWSDRWQHFEKDTDKLLSEFDEKDIYRFNLDGEIDFWSQLLANKEKKIETWAIYWYATIFKQHGLCLNPEKSFVRNIGLDSSGVHCSESYDMDNLFLNQNTRMSFPEELIEDKRSVEKIKSMQRRNRKKKPFAVRAINKASRYFMGKNIIR